MTFIAISTNNISNVKTSYVSSVTEQIPTNTYTSVTGSEITYEPDSDATWIVYDIQFTAYSRSSSHLVLYGALVYEENSSETGFEYTFTADGYNDGGYLLRYKFLIPTYSGSRIWKFKVRTNYGSTYEPGLHVDEDGNKYFPITKMYSII